MDTDRKNNRGKDRHSLEGTEGVTDYGYEALPTKTFLIKKTKTTKAMIYSCCYVALIL